MVDRVRNLEETKKLICYTLDTLGAIQDLKRNPKGKGVGIFDLRGQLCSTCMAPHTRQR